MRLGNRRPFLPAATDSLLSSAEDTPAEQDLATNLSERTDRSTRTLPADGTPITLTTGKKRTSLGKLVKPASQSQTSLLIEYFENGRVRVTPSSKTHEGIEGHIVGSEPAGMRGTSQKHRILLDSDSNIINDSVSAVDSELPIRRSKAPVEIEVYEGSDLSVPSEARDPRYLVAGSDISSMPAESMLGVSRPAIMTHHAPSSSLNRSEISEISELSEKENLKPPVIPTGINKSNERLARNIVEKITNKPRTSVTKSALSDTSRSRSSVSREVEGTEPRRRTAKNIEDDSITGTASSLVSGSAISAGSRGVDQRSVRSGTSNVSVTNPKLLQTVEDVVRRLILPELKEIKKDTRHVSQSKRHKETYPSDSYESSSVSREETTRRRSSGSKSKRRSSGREHGHRVSSGSRRHHKTLDYDSPSEQSYQRTESVESTSVDGDRKPRKHSKSHRAKDAAAGAIAGAALTAAALKHHESGSSLDHRERRKKRSKSRSSRSQSASVAESEEIFQKHDVPPMPMRSDLGSELTRSSLLSSNTNGTATPTRREVREVVHGSPNELLSPVSHTPSRTPIEKSSPNKFLNIQRGLGTHHGNSSEQDLSGHHRGDEDEELTEDASPQFTRDGFGPLSQGLLTDPERAKAYERNLHTQHPIRRGLSPIQSVASYATTEPNRTSLIQPRSNESLSSEPRERDFKDQISIASLSSAPSTDLAKSRRPQAVSLENRSEVMLPHKEGTARGVDTDDFYEDQHTQNDHYRDSLLSEPQSVDDPYLDKVTAGQHLGYAYRANPEYVHTPPEVESAVASLYEPSLMDSRGNLSPTRSNHSGSMDQYDTGSQRSLGRDLDVPKSGSPLKQQLSHHSQESLQKGAAMSPVQSVSRSPSPPTETPAVMKAVETAIPGPTSETQDAASPESEITTNPSVIQGPIGGYEHGDRNHWPYGPTPPPVKDNILPGSNRDLGLVGPPDLVPEALSISHPPAPQEGKRTIHITSQANQTPPGMIDEGYDTGVPNAPSPASLPRDRAMAAADRFSPGMEMDDPLDEEEDPFTSQKKNQYISGLSHAMSPLYDSATGQGIDRIESKDIVALMDHLTVRDAQRNARDTEILVTLVRTAAEMRNSFEDMKKFITDQDDMILNEADKQHEQTQKVIGGPRPAPPPASARFARTPASMSEDDDLPAKRKNIFKRAVKGLGTKNTAELQNIEGMLMQLLDDVAGLRTVQPGVLPGNEPRSTSFNSTDNARLPTDPGYEPEGQAGTSSTGDRSGIFSNSSSRQADYRGFGRQESANRVSTVMEGDEEYDDQVEPAEQTTPKASFARGASEPLRTPPRAQPTNQGALSNEHTPHYSTEGSSGRKHKSFASWLLPKAVSRWSKTTASSTGDYRQSTLTKPRPYSQVSQSGSNLGEFDYDHHGDDRIRSNTSLQNEQYQSENRPPSPLIPSQVSSNQPKYQAHRNSVNLQHPQPRQGPTGRYQSRLESEAQYYNDENDPISPNSVTSSQWEAQAGVTAMPSAGPNGQYLHGGHLSPISDGGYSETSTAMLERDGRRSVSSQNQGPPHPPKIPHDNDPLIPPRPPKLPMSPAGARGQTYVDQVAAARAGSPALDKVCRQTIVLRIGQQANVKQSPVAALRNSPGQTRKPSGPRPLSTSGSYGAAKGARSGDTSTIKKTRFRGSPYHIDSDDGVVE